MKKNWNGLAVWAALLGLPAITFLLGDAPPAQAQQPEPRSLAQPWNRRWDELKEPRYVERENHRFFEVRHRAYTVIAPTAEEARAAAAEVGRTWQALDSFTAPLNPEYARPEFALGAVTVMIDSEPLRERNTPHTSLGLADEVGLVYVNTSFGQPPLGDQLSRLRQGAAQAYLHVAQLDRAMPDWAVAGVAAFVDQQLAPETERAEPRPALEDVNRHAWERVRTVQDAFGPARRDNIPGDAVQFFLEASDARGAVAFLRTWKLAAERAAEPDRGLRGAEQRAPREAEAVWNSLVPANLEQEIAAWRAEPHAGQPRPGEQFHALDANAQVRAAEMALLLKLARRLDEPVREGIAPKIIGFDEAGNLQEFSPPRLPAQPLEPRELIARLAAASPQGWATLDIDGSLLLSSEVDRLEARLGLREQRFRSELIDGRWTLSTRMADGRVLRAWLEDDLENPARPWLRTAFDAEIAASGGPLEEAEPAEDPPAPEEPIDREAGLRFLPR